MTQVAVRDQSDTKMAYISATTDYALGIVEEETELLVADAAIAKFACVSRLTTNPGRVLESLSTAGTANNFEGVALEAATASGQYIKVLTKGKCPVKVAAACAASAALYTTAVAGVADDVRAATSVAVGHTCTAIDTPSTGLAWAFIKDADALVLA